MMNIKNFDEIIQQIKSQVAIQELVAEFIPLKKSGSGYKGLCPFHDDKNPSMHIHPQKGIFKCFVCGAGGDVITFHSKITNKSWKESLVDLAEKYGIRIDYGEENKTEIKIKTELYEINKSAIVFFKENLFSSNGKEALEYLKNERKLEATTIEQFEIGYALNKWDSLLSYLSNEKKYPKELLIASGLFIQRENSEGSYDRYRDRIIFPIYDERNRVVGFGGRIMPEAKDNSAKYINSPETLVFNKSYTLYGFNFAKDYIKEFDYSIVTEGYLDVISAHQYGLKNTVAPLGTAISSQQIKLLSKYSNSNKIFFCLDSDSAGQMAVENTYKLIQEIKGNTSLDVRVVSGLPAKDLDESLRLYGKEKIKELIEGSGQATNYVIDRITEKYKAAVKNSNSSNKAEYINSIIQTLNEIKDPIEQNEYCRYAAHKLNIDQELLHAKLKEQKKSTSRATNNKKDLNKFEMFSRERYYHAEIDLLTLYICSFPEVKEIREELIEINFIDEKIKLIKEYLDTIEEYVAPETIFEKISIEFNEFKHIMSLISDLSFKLDNLDETKHQYTSNKESIIKEAKECIGWWNTNKLEIKGLTGKLKDCTNVDEENEILLQMMKAIKKQKN